MKAKRRVMGHSCIESGYLANFYYHNPGWKKMLHIFRLRHGSDNPVELSETRILLLQFL
jgi:hypothetical protein